MALSPKKMRPQTLGHETLHARLSQYAPTTKLKTLGIQMDILEELKNNPAFMKEALSKLKDLPGPTGKKFYRYLSPAEDAARIFERYPGSYFKSPGHVNKIAELSAEEALHNFTNFLNLENILNVPAAFRYHGWWRHSRGHPWEVIAQEISTRGRKP
jgi:hypothetical protein